MMSVIVCVNGKQIVRVSAVRITKVPQGSCQYICYAKDWKKVIKYTYEDGAEVLAQKMLACYKEMEGNNAGK